MDQCSPSKVLVGEPWPKIERLRIEEPSSRLAFILVAALVLVLLMVSSLLLIGFGLYGMVNRDQTIIGPVLTLAGSVFSGMSGLVCGYFVSRRWH